MDVVKRSGRRQKFSIAKLERGLTKAFKEAKVSSARARENVTEIADSVYSSIRRRRSIRAVDLRRRVLGRLDRRSRAAARAWRSYDRRKR